MQRLVNINEYILAQGHNSITSSADQTQYINRLICEANLLTLVALVGKNSFINEQKF